MTGLANGVRAVGLDQGFFFRAAAMAADSITAMDQKTATGNESAVITR